MDWSGFFIIGTSIMEDSRRSSSTYTESMFLHVVKHNLFFCVFVFVVVFSIWLFCHEYSQFTLQQVKGETISLCPFYHFHRLYRHLDISWVIAAESSPLPIAGSRNRTWNAWYTLFRINPFDTCTGSCCCWENAWNSGNTGKYISCLDFSCNICSVQRLLLHPIVHAVKSHIISLVHNYVCFLP